MLSEKQKIIVPGDTEETITYTINYIISLAKKSIFKKSKFSIALSGGSTPKELYSHLCSNAFFDEIDWSKVWLFWSDERSCPPNDLDSNFHMAMEAGFKNTSIPKNQIFRMKVEENIEKHTKEYEDNIKKYLGKNLFDLVLLGIGEDGHCASLFPNTKALSETKRLAFENHVPQKNTWRMTLTYPCINNSSNICFFVLGRNKHLIVKEMFSSLKSDYPAMKVGTANNPALWILEKKVIL